MPLDVMNIVASQVILSNATTPPDPETTARVSVAAGLIAGPIGLVLPILAGRQAAEDGGGQEGVIVPDVEGESREAATAELEGSRLKVAVQKAFSTEVKSGTVVRQNPAAGSVRPLNSTVTIIVSDGAPPENGEDDSGDSVTRAEFDAGMKSLNDKLDQLIKAHGGPSTGSSPTTPGSTGSTSTTPAAGSGSTTLTPRGRTT